MELHTGNIEVNEGEFIIIPRGVEHKPVATEEVEIMLFEPVSTLNTGNILNDFTRDIEPIKKENQVRTYFQLWSLKKPSNVWHAFPS
jgi:hypothetical protein